MTTDDYNYMKALLCPFCRANLPDNFNLDRRIFMHTIPGTDELFECQAMALRLARGCVQDAIRRKSPTLIEE